jgi:hypothetical protein
MSTKKKHIPNAQETSYDVYLGISLLPLCSLTSHLHKEEGTGSRVDWGQRRSALVVEDLLEPEGVRSCDVTHVRCESHRSNYLFTSNYYLFHLLWVFDAGYLLTTKRLGSKFEPGSNFWILPEPRTGLVVQFNYLPEPWTELRSGSEKFRFELWFGTELRHPYVRASEFFKFVAFDELWSPWLHHFLASGAPILCIN